MFSGKKEKGEKVVRRTNERVMKWTMKAEGTEEQGRKERRYGWRVE